MRLYELIPLEEKEMFGKFFLHLFMNKFMLLKLLGYFLALRIITQRPLKYFLENKEAFSELNNIDESNIKEILDHDYSAMISMITHEKDAPDSLAMKNAVISVFFLRFLQHGKYFNRYVPEKKRGDRSLHPAETLILNILHHLIGSIQHNSSLLIHCYNVYIPMISSTSIFGRAN